MEYPYFNKLNSCMKIVSSNDCQKHKLILEYNRSVISRLTGIRRTNSSQIVIPYNPTDKR